MSAFARFVQDWQGRVSSEETTGAAGCLIVGGAAAAIFEPFRLYGFIVMGLGIAFMIGLKASSGRKLVKQDVSPEVSELLEELGRYAAEQRFESRFHPQLFRDLELMSDIWLEIESQLHEAQKDYAVTLADCRDAVREAIIDSVWLGRTIIRRGGMKKAKFAERCNDKHFGANALAEIAELRNDVRELRQLLLSRSDTAVERSRLQNTLAHLREREAALEELQVQTLDH